MNSLGNKSAMAAAIVLILSSAVGQCSISTYSNGYQASGIHGGLSEIQRGELSAILEDGLKLANQAKYQSAIEVFMRGQERATRLSSDEWMSKFLNALGFASYGLG